MFKMLKNEPVLTKIGFDTAENGPPKKNKTENNGRLEIPDGSSAR